MSSNRKVQELRKIFPHVSQDTIDANPQLSAKDIENFVLRGIAAQQAVDKVIKKAKPRQPREMNATEREFSFILEKQKSIGEITDWLFEGITLRWRSIKEVIRYTADFTVFRPCTNRRCDHLRIKLVEVKGPRTTRGKFERAVERFRHAKTVFPQFDFEMHQKDENKQWNRLL
jgi:hypothetical protein